MLHLYFGQNESLPKQIFLLLTGAKQVCNNWKELLTFSFISMTGFLGMHLFMCFMYLNKYTIYTQNKPTKNICTYTLRFGVSTIIQSLLRLNLFDQEYSKNCGILLQFKITIFYLRIFQNCFSIFTPVFSVT